MRKKGRERDGEMAGERAGESMGGQVRERERDEEKGAIWWKVDCQSSPKMHSWRGKRRE